MHALIDTHALIWFADGNHRLPANARQFVEDMTNVIYVSIASVWEMSIKEGLNKLRLGRPLKDFLNRELVSFDMLEINMAHALGTVALPQHHRDPFDRMLVAQALHEGLPVITGDSEFDAYGIQRIWDA